MAVPADWTVSKDGSRTDFLEPGGDRFLRIDQTQAPKADPVADWESQERHVSTRLEGYSRVKIGPVRVLNRNTITSPDRAYEWYWSTPAERWKDSMGLFDSFTQTFRPAA